jgi:hypothetical protein
VNAIESFRKAAPTADVHDLTAGTVTLAPPATVPGKAARVTGRVVGKVAAKAKQVVDTVLP